MLPRGGPPKKFFFEFVGKNEEKWRKGGREGEKEKGKGKGKGKVRGREKGEGVKGQGEVGRKKWE